MGIYANPFLLCNIGVYSTTGNVHVAAFRQDHPITDPNLLTFMLEQPNVDSIEVRNNTLRARVEKYFESVDTTVPLPMETNVDYYAYMVSESDRRVIGAFSARIPHAPAATVINSHHELSVDGVFISGNISESPIGYTYYVVLADHDINPANVETFLSTHNVPETGTVEGGAIATAIDVPRLNQPYDTEGNVMPFVQTTRNYNAYIHTVNQHMMRDTLRIEVPGSHASPPSNVVFVDTFPKYVDGNIFNQGNLTMGNLDGEIVFSTNIASAFNGNTTYYVSVYEGNFQNPEDLALLHHLYNSPMHTGNLNGQTDSEHLQIEGFYANADSDTTSPLERGRHYQMALLLLQTETNHYSGAIRLESLPTTYPQIDVPHFIAAPIKHI